MIIPFGKHRGREVEEVPSDYLRWLMEQEWFESERWEELYVEVEDELETRERSYAHFYEYEEG